MTDAAASGAGPAQPDVSDLKTFDVPDPVRVGRSSKIAYVIAAAGIGAACFAMNAMQLEHYFAVLQNPDESERNHTRAHNWIEELPPAETLPRILALADPAVRGSFYEQLGATGDPAQLPAIAAFLHTLATDDERYYDQEWHTRDVCKHLAGFPADQVGPLLVAAWTDAPEKMQPPLLEAIEALPPEAVLDPVLAVADPVARGRFHRVLATSGDPDQIDAIVAYVAAESASTSRRFEAEAASLVAFGEAGTARLEAALQRTERPVINLAAEALRDVNLPFLTTHCRATLGEYAEGVYGKEGLAWAFEVNRRWEELRIAPPEERRTSAITVADANRARAVLDEFETRSFRILEMLKAMGPIANNEEVDFCFMQGLSSFSKEVAEHCAAALQQRCTMEQLVDVLFRFIAKKSAFQLREVNVYESMLNSTGPPGAARVAANLERLLREAEGDLTRVFWMYKLMGHRVLKEIGTAAQIPVLEQYAADTESFIYSKRTALGKTEETEVRYADEAQRAIAAIREREGK